MKYILLLVIMLFAVPHVHAGFLVKKSVVAHVATGTSATTAELASMQTEKLHAPIDNWAQRGWIGIVSVICGVLGFIAPLFGFAALLLGFIGMNGKRNRHTGVAIAGFVLGLAVVLLVIFGGFTGWGIS